MAFLNMSDVLGGVDARRSVRSLIKILSPIYWFKFARLLNGVENLCLKKRVHVAGSI